ncbi:tyrosine-type recombinase/integrase [Microvirga sp. 3-52]|uniref:tyrosine-type recombinase/integrase n=1 Tax=Microvirga sp. 3-52 TaxID=2792425 RepID=UPI001ACCB57D|nr:site-specific integrase [Microvirga sp. 3-52]MBO1904034.1 tyrosine-type recombinase/integrase [Microvirga sp. 3-52]MBS7451645.1 tyrosine-type recombinase/integrase [Microvirga sp. 3-52]
MARQINRLSARKVETIKEAGRHADGGNLYLVVDKSLARRWVFLFRWNGRLREMGLGSARDVPLARARELAAEARSQLAAGRDPLQAREVAQAVPTFGEMADEVIAAHSPSWRNDKHRAQWQMTLTRYAAPLRELLINEVDTDAVLNVLKPLWDTKSETASRLRGRIEKVLDAAKAKGLRSGENPARWRGHLDHLLPKRQRLTRGHHAALPIDSMQDFMTKLRQRDAVAAWALEFCILTAARSGEVLGARWEEIDRERRIWTVPRERMKAGREHRVPLPEAVLAILDKLEPVRTEDNPFVFPGRRAGRPLSVMSMEMVLRRMKRNDITVHGFRSTFRDWASERTGFSHEVCEMALAHTVANKVEAAYRRGDLLERRRELMGAWAAFLAPTPEKIVRLERITA